MDDVNQGLERDHFYLGEFCIAAEECTVQNGEISTKITPRAMEVLSYLAARSGEVVSIDELLTEIWDQPYTGSNAVYKCITELRKAFVDPAHESRILQTVPKRGYKILVPMLTQPGIEAGVELDPTAIRPSENSRRRIVLVCATVLAIGMFAGWYWNPLEPCWMTPAGCGTPESTVLFVSSPKGGADQALSIELNDSLLERLTAYEWIIVTSDGAMNADYILESSFRSDSDVRFELKKISDSTLLYTKSFTLLENINGATLGRYVGDAMSVLLDPNEIEIMRYNNVSDATAWRMYRGLPRRYPQNLDAIVGRVDVLRSILLLDRGFREAYIGLAMSLRQLVSLDQLEQFATRRNETIRILKTVQSEDVGTEPIRIVSLMLAGMFGDLYDQERLLRERILQGPEPEIPEGDIEFRHYGFYYEQYAQLLRTSHRQDAADAYQLAGILKCRVDDECESFGSSVDATFERLAFDQDWSGLESKYRAVLDVQSGSVEALTGFVGLLAKLHRFEEAERFLVELQQVDPVGFWYLHANAYLSFYKEPLRRSEHWSEYRLGGGSGLSKGLLAIRLQHFIEASEIFSNLSVVEKQLARRTFWIDQYVHGNPEVGNSPEFGAILSALGLGQQWQNHLDEKLRELATATGVQPDGSLSPNLTELRRKYMSN
ncbi:MAG: hypothetical protein GKR90_14030 [Pseudomonadales bacterium]|nr:hypothetical protein [Pseudomonadales bacterium]